MRTSEQEQAAYREIHPDRVYTAEETARLLRPGKPLSVDTVYRLGASKQLRKTPLGPRGGLTGFLGRDILAYLRGERGAA